MARIQQLGPELQREVLDFAEFLAHKRPQLAPMQDPHGLWAGRSRELTAEEITEARRVQWGGFSRERV